MGLAALLLKAAELIQQREDAGADSDDMLVPQQASVRPAASWRSAPRRSRVPDDEYGNSGGSSDDDVAAVPHGRRAAGQAKAAGRGKGSRGPMQHNEVEKRRRAYLAACYIELKGMLPAIASSKASNVCILRTAIEQIQGLEADERELDSELARLRMRQKELLAARGGPAPYTPPARFTPLSEGSDAEMVVPDSTDRTVSPDLDHAITYAYSQHLNAAHNPAAKLGVYTAGHTGGGAIRRRSRSRPARFL